MRGGEVVSYICRMSCTSACHGAAKRVSHSEITLMTFDISRHTPQNSLKSVYLCVCVSVLLLCNDECVVVPALRHFQVRKDPRNALPSCQVARMSAMICHKSKLKQKG